MPTPTPDLEPAQTPTIVGFIWFSDTPTPTNTPLPARPAISTLRTIIVAAPVVAPVVAAAVPLIIPELQMTATQAPTVASTAAPSIAPAGGVVIAHIEYDGAVYQVESDEYAEIVNQGSVAVNLDGWTLDAGSGVLFQFGGVVLQPRQMIRVYTDEVHHETGGLTFGSDTPIWNNSGDCGTLFNASGAQVFHLCYQ